MRLRRFAVTVLSVATFSLIYAAERSSDSRTAFIERAWPSVYEKVQNLFEEEFSRTNDVVVLRNLPDALLADLEGLFDRPRLRARRRGERHHRCGDERCCEESSPGRQHSL